MIFDFKERLGLSVWDTSDLIYSPPKSLSDYVGHIKSFVVNNSILLVPFVLGTIISTSIDFYSFSIEKSILDYEPEHQIYQNRRAKILKGKRDIDSIDSFVLSLTPYISDSIYPNLFLSFLSPIISIDSSITELSLSKKASSLRLVSANPDFLSAAFSTLDQHPLVQDSGISFTSLKSSNDGETASSNSSSPSNEIEIQFTYNYALAPDLYSLFEKANSQALAAKSALFQL